MENVLGEVAQFHNFAVLGDGNVVDEARTVAVAVRTTILDGLPNRFFSITLAGVNCDAEILALNIVKGVDMLFGWITAFFTREIESHNAARAKVDGELGHFEGHVHIAHGADDQAGRNSKVVFTALQSL